jgi:hypothetical protein
MEIRILCFIIIFFYVLKFRRLPAVGHNFLSILKLKISQVQYLRDIFTSDSKIDSDLRNALLCR